MYIGQVNFFMGFIAGLKAFTAAVLGGIGNIAGAVLGAFLLGILETFGAAYLGGEWQDVFAFGVLILVLVFRPTGLLGERVTADGRADGGGQPAAGRRQGRGQGPVPARLRLPLVAAPVGAAGRPRSASYLYWTRDLASGCEGVPLTGRLVDFGFGGVRTWSLVVSLAAVVYGGAGAAHAGRATSTQGRGAGPARHRPGRAAADLGASPWCRSCDVEFSRHRPRPLGHAAPAGVLAWLARAAAC